MKIRKIKFKNINSLRGEHEVDFTKNPLAESRLFAITGPTGSGKSTILDVIALALFNRVPRLGKVSKNFVAQSGALLTRNTDEAFASVEYQCGKGVFRSSWSISTTRNNTLRDYEMELADVVSGKNLDLKKSDVPGKNEELIGLNYDQFVKSIMLAQGEFAQFLKVNKSERGELLEKITGTGVYRKLGQKAFEKKQQFAKSLEDLRKEEVIHRNALLSADELKETRKQNTELEKQSSEKEKNLKALEEQLKLREDFAKIQLLKKQKQEEVELQKKKLGDFEEEHGKRLKKHEATSPFAEKLEQWKRIGEKITEASKEAVALSKSKIELAVNRESLLKKVEDLVLSEVSEDAVKTELEKFKNRVEKFEKQISEKQQEYRSKKNELIAKGENWDFVPNVKDPEEDLEKLQSWQLETARRKEELSAKLGGINLENPQSEDARLEKKLFTLRKGADWSIELTKLEKNLKEEKQKLEKKAEDQKMLPGKIEKLESQKEKSELKVKSLRLELENQKLRASLKEKRAELQDGKPCPLCGSTEHPWSDHAPEADDELMKKLQQAEKDLESVGKELSNSEANLKHLLKELEELQSRIENLQKEIENLNQRLKSECGEWLKDEPVDWEKLIEQTETQRKSLREFGDIQKQAKGIESCLPIVESMIAISREGKKLAAEKNKLFTGDDISKTCGELRDSWTDINHRLKSLEEQSQKLKQEQAKLEKEKKQLQNELSPALREKGFDGIEDAISKRLPEEKYHQLNRQFSDLKEAFKTSETGFKSTAGQLDELKAKLTEEEDEQLEKFHRELKSELTEILENWEEVKRKLKNHTENLQRVENVQKRIAEEEKTGRKWELLNQLIGDATGKKFNDFAQDLTLQQLLALANNRLSQLTDRYRVASPQGDEDDSLIAIDDHMGGQRRSVKTLSGGETFVLSLSLALALSDLASKNVEINSLFIDEGFGTLDPETLDQTLDTLEKLQTESSKIIGIISHVEALKERISTQIQLERNGQGYSSLKVV
ncbi:SbcC/MukB-like Walker B domain-containing protein [Halocola ammonii]